VKSRGKVWLVGAGPGDPELLTLKAARVLRDADVVLCDDLVDAALLQHVASTARIVHVGKRGGCASTLQAFIEQLMIHEALAGNRVVRLKGGDPFVFGRGGEEVAALRTHGIDVEVVSGVTSGIAAAAAAGIPVTHRAHSQGVVLVTGQAHSNREGPDWTALARSGLTLVIYMGLARCADIARSLQKGGLAGKTPVAVICNGTRANQRAVRTTLANLEQVVQRERLTSPAIIVIGDVVNALGVIEQEPAHVHNCAA
jgi:uroporphyrin-III C-methyltransferase